MIEIIVKELPIPWAAPRLGKYGVYSPRARHKRYIRSLIRDIYKGELIKDQVICDINFFLPIPKSTSQNNRLLMLCGQKRPKCKPDRINLGKLAEDCLEGIVLKNDSQIVGGRVDKYYGDEPKTVFIIHKL